MSKVKYDTWERWIGNPTPPGQRRGQYLWNNAPAHITDACANDIFFDPFYEDDEDSAKLQRFMILAWLLWDEPDANDEEISEAKAMADAIVGG